MNGIEANTPSGDGLPEVTSKKATLQPCAGGTEISELAALRADVN